MLDLSSQEGRSWVVVGGDVLLKWTHNRLTHRGWGAVLYPTGVGAHSLGGGGGVVSIVSRTQVWCVLWVTPVRVPDLLSLTV